MHPTYPRKSLFNTEDYTIFCPTIGREYHLSVWLPRSYRTSNQSYPVIYQLDGDMWFGFAAGVSFALQYEDTPEAIVVGINYDIESYDQWLALRQLDFFPPGFTDEPDGYADKFLDALVQEMIPFIDANYRTIPADRTLYGFSASGFFVLYTLLQQPDVFLRYISGSGLWESAYTNLMSRDHKLRERVSTEPIRLYLSVGELEKGQLAGFQQLSVYLIDNYPEIKLTTEVFPGEGHNLEVMVLTYLHGIRQVFSDE